MPITRRKFLAGAVVGSGAVLPRRGVALSAVDGSGEPLPASPGPDDSPDWTFFVINDTCPDYTWGNDEASTRHNFAELVRAHLDLMNMTDGDEPPDRDRFNMTTTHEGSASSWAEPSRIRAPRVTPAARRAIGRSESCRDDSPRIRSQAARAGSIDLHVAQALGGVTESL